MRSSPIGTTTIASLAALAAVLPEHADAALTGYLKIPDIEGESTSKEHKDWIDILSWSWGLAGDGKKACKDAVALTKMMDASSPYLAQAVADGTRFATVELLQTTTGENATEFFRLSLGNVGVSSYDVNAGSDARPAENFSLDFEYAKGRYTRRDAEGRVVGTDEFFIDSKSCE